MRILLILSCLAVLFSGSQILAGEKPSSQPKNALIKTELGDLAITLDWTSAPENASTFVRYTRDGIYTGSSFHETDVDCIYGGKPNPAKKFPGIASSGNMAPDKGPAGEFKRPNRKGAFGFRRTVGTCNPTKRSNSTQFYISFLDDPKADGQFTVFGTIEVEPSVMEAIKARLQKKEPLPLSVEIGEK